MTTETSWKDNRHYALSQQIDGVLTLDQNRLHRWGRLQDLLRYQCPLEPLLEHRRLPLLPGLRLQQPTWTPPRRRSQGPEFSPLLEMS